MTPELEQKIAKALHHWEEVDRGVDRARRDLSTSMRDPEIQNYLDKKRAEGTLPPPRLSGGY